MEVVTPLRAVRMVVQYDGTDFAGFQRQPARQGQHRGGRPSVQEMLEHALSRLTGTVERVVGAGRTDAGVHALGQVVHWRTAHPVPVSRLPQVLNGRLPAAIRVVEAEEVPLAFHARRDARSRIYCYHILNSPRPNPLAGRFSWWVPGPLEVEPMGRLLEAMVGVRDFRAVGSPLAPGRSTVRQVFATRLDVQPLRDGGKLVRLSVEADAFLYRMMRLLAGLAVRVGQGAVPVEQALAAVQAVPQGQHQEQPQAHSQPRPAAGGPRRLAAAAPACGLCLVHVHYGPPPAGLQHLGGALDTLVGLWLEWPRGLRPGQG